MMRCKATTWEGDKFLRCTRSALFHPYGLHRWDNANPGRPPQPGAGLVRAFYAVTGVSLLLGSSALAAGAPYTIWVSLFALAGFMCGYGIWLEKQLPLGKVRRRGE